MAVFKRTIFPSALTLKKAMVECLEQTLKGEGTSPFAVMLSGGQTPLDIYKMLMKSGGKASEEAHILYSDERDVPSSSEENNYHHTVELLNHLCIPASRVMRVHTGQPIEMAASQYHHELHRFIDRGGRITLGLLGIGTDGHTASLFSSADLERGLGHYAVAIPHEPKPDRISVTPKLLARVERLIILAIGPEKHGIVTKLLAQPEGVVAGLALTDAANVEIWQS